MPPCQRRGAFSPMFTSISVRRAHSTVQGLLGASTARALLPHPARFSPRVRSEVAPHSHNLTVMQIGYADNQTFVSTIGILT